MVLGTKSKKKKRTEGYATNRDKGNYNYIILKPALETKSKVFSVGF